MRHTAGVICVSCRPLHLLLTRGSSSDGPLLGRGFVEVMCCPAVAFMAATRAATTRAASAAAFSAADAAASAAFAFNVGGTFATDALKASNISFINSAVAARRDAAASDASGDIDAASAEESWLTPWWLCVGVVDE